MMQNSVKMSDIAEKLGISSVTVSKALAGKKGVSDELRKKIEKDPANCEYIKTEFGKGYIFSKEKVIQK